MSQLRSPFRLALVLVPLLAALDAQALTFKGPGDLFPRELQTGRKVLLHPFQENPVKLPGALGLFQDGTLELEAAVAKAVRGSNLLNPMIEMRFKDTTSGMALTSGGSSRDASFYVNGIPLCGFQLRAHAAADRSVLMLGDLPAVDGDVRFAPADWPAQELAVDKAGAALAGKAGELTVSAANRCLFVQNGGLLPVWKLRVQKGGLPYEVLADGYEVQKLEAGFFDAVDGKASVYAQNILEEAKIDYTLPGLVGDGNLSSDWLQTVFPGKTQKYPKANETTNVFNYEKTDPKFMESSTFSHAEMHRQFAEKIGFAWYGPKPIQIMMHIKPGGYLDKISGEWVGGKANNALFIPGSSDDGTLPQIQIDDGDGVDLQNLSTDGDVVSHEFGHHIVYQTLRSTTGQSLAMHEGLADFFVFSRTGDPFLGESICPEGTGACIPGLPAGIKALRSAALDFRYKDENWVEWAGASNRLGHLHGQLVSGLLWDLRAQNEMTADDVTHLALKAVTYFKSDSGFRDLIISMFMADKELFAGRDYARLTKHVQDRGLAEFLDGITTADAALPALAGGGASAGGIGTIGVDPNAKAKKETKSSSNPLACGVVPGADASSALALAGLLILAAPLLAGLLPKPERARAKGARAAKKPGDKNKA